MCYYIFGFGFAFGGEFHDGVGGNSFIGSTYFALDNLPASKLPFFLFQFGVTAAVCSIVTGAIEERMHLSTYLPLTIYVAAFVYPVASHWTTSNTGICSFPTEHTHRSYAFLASMHVWMRLYFPSKHTIRSYNLPCKHTKRKCAFPASIY